MTTMLNANHNNTNYDNKGRNVPSIIMLTLLRALRAIRAFNKSLSTLYYSFLTNQNKFANQNKFSYVPDAQTISGLVLSS